MAFDITTWKYLLKTRLPGWLARMNSAGVHSTYYFISASVFLPIVQAMQAGNLEPLLFANIASGLGANLLANIVQNWRDEASAVEQLQQAAANDPDLHAKLNALLAELDALHTAELVLSDADKAWFTATLQGELSQLQHGIRYQATVNGSGAVAQGNGATALGAGAILFQGENKGNVIIHQAPDPRELKKEKNTTAREKYLKKLRNHCQALPLAVLGGEDAEEAISLDTVYIDLDTQLNILPARLETIQKGEKVSLSNDLFLDAEVSKESLTVARARLISEKKVVSLPVLHAVSLTDRVVLLGDPGAGKSTFVRKLLGLQAAVLLKEHAPLMHISADLLPVLVVLRELALKLDIAHFEKLSGDEKKKKLLAAFDAYLSEGLEPGFKAAFFESFSAGKVLLVLDGLDEVPQDMRQRVRAGVAVLLAAYGIERLVITSRIRSYTGDAVFVGLQTFTIRPFSEAQIANFVRAWYATRAELTERERTARVNGLILAATGNLAEIASNPMMLTSMALIHQKDTELPDERVRLYKLVVDVLLRRWQKHKQGEELSPSFGLMTFLKDEPRLLAALARLAYEAHKTAKGIKETADLPRSEALAILEQKEFLDHAGLAAEFLDYVDQRAGLLKGNGGELSKPTSYSFPHRTFQEYLAGTYMVRGRSPAREYERLAAEGDHWALAAQLGSEELLYNTANVGQHAMLDLAYELCPNASPQTALAQRLALWSAAMALTAGKANVEADDKATGGGAYLRRLISALLAGMQGDLLPPLERVEAGRMLAKLGDPRPEVLTCSRMVFSHIPAGEFLFGNEKKPVTIDSDYWIGKYPVTNAQFDEFVAAEGYKNPAYWGEAIEVGYWSETGFKGDFDYKPRTSPNDYAEPFTLLNHPVVGISWYEALAFTRWLTAQGAAISQHWSVSGGESIFQTLREAGKLQVSLPTEEQWEKAARGPDGREYPWDGDFDPNKANTDETGIKTTSAVGAFLGGASLYDLLDASGNTWEWTLSAYDTSPHKAVRGGSFDYTAELVRCAFRSWRLPDYGNYNFGFRMVVRA